VPASRPDVLVLGGGGVLGEAWLRACLAGLEAETGWDLRACDAFVGTSAGSIVAATLAAGRRPTTAPDLPKVPDPFRREVEGWRAPLAKGSGTFLRVVEGSLGRVVPAVSAGIAPAGAVARAAALKRGKRATREIPGLRAALERMGSAFDGRLRVTAVDAATGRRVVFGAPGAPATSVAEAVMASCSVPWMFRPVEIGGREYVDGGYWSAANLDVAPVERGTEVLCLNPTQTPRLAVDRLGAMRVFSRTTTAAEALALKRRGARVRIVAPDAATVAAIGPDLFTSRRRRDVEAAAHAQGRRLATAT
jgi:NTE family protein